MSDVHANFGYGVVTVAPSPATSGTALSVSNADAAAFPDPASGEYNVTVWPDASQPTNGTAEILRFTAKGAADSGGAGHTQFTITRTQESTSARIVIIGDQLAISITKKTLTDVETVANAAQPGDADLTTIAGLADPNADRLLFWDDSASSYAYLTAGVGLIFSGTTMTPRDASATQTGIVELATTAETTTGTDAARAVTPAALHEMTSLAGAVWFLDEDDMASNSATKVASQQSIKAYVDGALGGAWTATTPATTGWDATPTKTGCKYIQIGKTIIFNFKVAGTSNANTAIIALPVTAATGTDTEIALGLARDNGTYITTACRGLIDSSSYTEIQCFKDMTSAVWTTSGAKEVRGIIIYEAA